jgi:hypothetical protein
VANDKDKDNEQPRNVLKAPAAKHERKKSISATDPRRQRQTKKEKAGLAADGRGQGQTKKQKHI